MGGKRMSVRQLKELIFQKKWDSIVKQYLVSDICLSLNFSEAMNLTNHLFYDDIQNDENQQYALKLAFEIKNRFKSDWEQDWKNEIFLGNLCDMLWLYEERYLCYKRAYDKLLDPPHELLLFLAGCQFAPDPPITKDESEFYLKKALDKKVTAEAALMMRSLSRDKNDQHQEKYWDGIYKKLDKEKVHASIVVPDVLQK